MLGQSLYTILASLSKMADLAGVRLVVFRVGDLTCAAEAATVREVLAALPATRIPGASSIVTGLINVRGRLATLVDGRRALGLAPGSGDGPIILLDVGEKTAGLAVDAVVDLVSVAADDLVEREELPGVDPRLVRAVGRRADTTFVLLDTDALLTPILAA